eukprot:6206654-Pleurochrysis_carterae.AAC.3
MIALKKKGDAGSHPVNWRPAEDYSIPFAPFFLFSVFDSPSLLFTPSECSPLAFPAFFFRTAKGLLCHFALSFSGTGSGFGSGFGSFGSAQNESLSRSFDEGAFGAEWEQGAHARGRGRAYGRARARTLAQG